MGQGNRYSKEMKDRAVRMVLEHQGEYNSQWSAISSIAPKIGCTGEPLRRWVRQAERDQGARAGLTTPERQSNQLKRANEILRQASAFFAQAELDRIPR